jgi:hypothetical protein
MGMSDDKVIYLAFKNEHIEPDTRDLMACKVCRNKTFIVIYEPEKFPLMQCAACETQIGHFGWATRFVRIAASVS